VPKVPNPILQQNPKACCEICEWITNVNTLVSIWKRILNAVMTL